ncbi:MAG: cobalt-precorrin-5B (C(1))-methyltransferase [Alphaproteobacteria bacterium]|jgi:cobalt-precorrin-5B (C1)-methyltransferase
MIAPMNRKPTSPLRRGWTTGACAAAAARAAFRALHTGAFERTVSLRLPRGETPVFPLVQTALERDADGPYAIAGVVKDAGDDPDVTHGVTVLAIVRPGVAGEGVTFHAGEGVGTITKPGLPLPPGEPAINPAPRAMIAQGVAAVADELGVSGDASITISIPGGATIAEQTWNPRLGILGGLSVLGTTGIVIPYSCSAWIHSIHRGVDVARETGVTHIAGATGKTSEAAVKALYGLDDGALIDMGDFAGGLLKYLRRHPTPRLTIAGGFAKLTKLAQGDLDLHSSRSQVNFERLAQLVKKLAPTLSDDLFNNIQTANTAAEVLTLAEGIDLPDVIAAQARAVAMATLSGGVEVDVLVIDRKGERIGYAGF